MYFTHIFLFFLFLYNCFKDIPRPPIYSLLFTGGSTEKLAVVSSDFASGGRFSVLNPELQISTPNFLNVHSDAVVRYQREKVIIINRLNRDSIQVLDPNLGFLLEKEFSTGSGTNPQDLVWVDNTRAFVTLYNSNELKIFDMSLGLATRSISLSHLVEKSSSGSSGIDGLVEPHRMYQKDNSLFVQLQRLDRNDVSGFPAPNTNSLLIEINLQTETIVREIPTPVPNPISRIQEISIFGEPHLLMCLAGRLGFISQLDGGIFAFRLSDRSFINQPIYSETIAGGDILDFVVYSETEGYAFILDKSFNKFIQKFNPQTGEKILELAYFPSTAGTIAGLAISKSGKLYIADANFQNPGITIFDITSPKPRKLNPTPIPVGLRPFDMVVIEK